MNKNIFLVGVVLISSILFSTNSTITSLDNITHSLQYGDCLNVSMDGNGSINICAPNFPIININLTGDSNYINNTDSGAINIGCFNQKLNNTISLTFSGNTTISQTNTTVICPAFPALNLRTNLSSGQTMTSLDTDVRFNYSIYCSVGVVSGACNFASNITPTTSDQYLQNVSGLDIHILPIPTNYCYENRYETTTTSNIFRSDKCNDTFISNIPSGGCPSGTSCQYPPVACPTCQTCQTCTTCETCKTCAVCPTQPDCPVNVTSPLISSIISNCTSPLQLVCPTAFGDYCGTSEVISGDYKGCIERIQNTSTTNYNTCSVSLSQKTYEAEQCKQGNQGFTDTMILFIEAICVIVIMCAITFALWEFVLKKNVKNE